MAARLRSPIGFLAAVLAITFVAETGVMWLLHSVVSVRSVWAESLLDACLLAMITAPVLWWALIGPLRGIAVAERARAELALWGGDLGLWDWDVRSGQVVRDGRWAQMLGCAPSEVEGSIRTWEGLIHPDDRARVLETVKENLEGLVPSFREEYRIRTRSGGWKWILDSGKIVERDASGRPLRVVGTHLDITDRKRAEEALAESEHLFREAAENFPGGFFLADANARDVLFVNRAYEEVTGRSCEGFRQDLRSFLEAVHPEDRERVEAAFVESQRTGSFSDVHRILRADGSVRWVSARVSAVRNGRGETVRFVGTLQDITEMRRAEELEQRAQRLESLGILAGGVAHDFNNLLGVVLGNAELALARLPEASPARPKLQGAIAAIEGAAALAKKMLAFSGGGRFELRLVDLSELIREQRTRYERLVPANARLVTVLADALPSIEADAGQLHQALTNLVVNAAEAIGQREGTLTVSTRSEELRGLPEDEALWQHTGQALVPGRYAILEVRDDGCGMDPATVPRIFDPFFTTKFTGRGLGLGMVLGIVRGHRGGLSVESAPGRGSVFTLAFPAVRAQNAEGGP